MVFDKNGEKTLALHSPNTFDGNERLVLLPYLSCK